jgi:glycosyltransferase involved in cell wall biosynthesis
LTEIVGLPAEKVRSLEYWCDHQFYRPQRSVQGDYILSVGRECRDYATLQAAAADLDYRLHIVASGWAPVDGFAATSAVESHRNITVGRGYSFRDLRDVYAGARFIVVPLKRVSYAAGITTIVEGMAMGKAVIVSASPGIVDYVKDGVSGRLVPVGDTAALRRAIIDLWEHPERAAAMGQYNRRWIEQAINTDRYVTRVAAMMGCPA